MLSCKTRTLFVVTRIINVIRAQNMRKFIWLKKIGVKPEGPLKLLLFLYICFNVSFLSILKYLVFHFREAYKAYGMVLGHFLPSFPFQLRNTNCKINLRTGKIHFPPIVLSLYGDCYFMQYKSSCNKGVCHVIIVSNRPIQLTI